MTLKVLIAVIVILVILTALAIPLLMGKGGIILVRKYTTFRNEEEKKKGQRLCRQTGLGLLAIDVLLLLAVIFNAYLPGYFLYILIAAILGVVALVYYSQNKTIQELVDMQKDEDKKNGK